jgi:hypothetical protein
VFFRLATQSDAKTNKCNRLPEPWGEIELTIDRAGRPHPYHRGEGVKLTLQNITFKGLVRFGRRGPPKQCLLIKVKAGSREVKKNTMCPETIAAYTLHGLKNSD